MVKLDDDLFIKKLEKTGVKGVRAKLAAGNYRVKKIPVIEKWLKQQATRPAETKPPPEVKKPAPPTPPAQKKPATSKKQPAKGKKGKK